MKKLIMLAMVVGLIICGCIDSYESQRIREAREEKEYYEKTHALQIDDKWEWRVDGNYSYIKGSVKNIGAKPIRYFEVHAIYTDTSGNVLDTAYTNSGEMLQPGWSKRFEIMHAYRSEFKRASVRVENIRFAR